jgi:hypothetical protein
VKMSFLQVVEGVGDRGYIGDRCSFNLKTTAFEVLYLNAQLLQLELN